MSDPSFNFEYRPTEKMLVVTLMKYWDERVAEAYQEAAVASLTMSKTKGLRRVLVDVRDFGIQSQETAAVLSQLAQNQNMAEYRTALLVGSVLQKLQVRRATLGEQTQIFESESEARRWLLEG